MIGGIGTYQLREDILRTHHFSTELKVEASMVPPRPSKADRIDEADEFSLDLEAASRLAVEVLKRSVGTPRGRDAFLTALDGESEFTRSHTEEGAMLAEIAPFLETLDLDRGPEIGGGEPPEFLAARRDGSESARQGVRLQHDCICAVDPTTDRVFVANDLGYQEIVAVSQMAISQLLVWRLQGAGIELNATNAFHRVCALLGCEDSRARNRGGLSETSVRDGGAWIAAVKTAGPLIA